VTGASSGIGRACALHLDGLGHRVFAGVRTEAAAESLRRAASDRLVPVLLDVTDAEAIDAAHRSIEAGLDGRGLVGLVNNAGVAHGGPIEYLPLDEWRAQLEVNVIGQVAVTQALLEALRRGPGRIANIGSVGARTPLPFLSPYAASKTALWAVGESLRGELRPWGIHVATIEPGAIATEIWRKGGEQAKAASDALPPRGRELYGQALANVDGIISETTAHALPPSKVADVVEHALTSPKPKDRYLIGREARKQVVARRLLGWKRFDAIIAKRMGLG